MNKLNLEACLDVAEKNIAEMDEVSTRLDEMQKM